MVTIKAAAKSSSMPIQDKLSQILNSEETLRHLLSLEKKRRRMSENQLVFLGTANVADYFWCAKQAAFKSHENELMFFSVYLSDRIDYAERLGLIDRLPRKKEALLDIGAEITFEDVESLLKQKADFYIRVTDALEMVSPQGEKVMLINPDLPARERQYFEVLAKKKGIRIISSEEAPPMVLGEMLQTTRAEHYPTIRWNFPWDGHVIVGVPDGVTDKFVYEFKTTRNGFLQRFMKPVAFAQANLYGLFFRREQKRVQIYVLEEQETKTWEESVDKESAEDLLENFSRATKGWEPPPPKPWKCKPCKFSAKCGGGIKL